MKPLPLLLAASLAGNVALVAIVSLRPDPSTKVAQRYLAANSASVVGSTAKNGDVAALQSALASGDPAALAAVGVSADTIRELTVGRAFDIAVDRMRRMQTKQETVRYWRNPPSSNDAVLQLERRRTEQNLNKAMDRAYGEDLEKLFNGNSSGRERLPPETRERLARIEKDYEEMSLQINADQVGGLSLPSDQEKLKLLRAARERDLDAALTPAERELIALSDSPTASAVRDRFGDALDTEEDYKKIFALQKAFDDRFNSPGFRTGPQGPEQLRSRREAEKNLLEEIRAMLSPEQWATVQRTNDLDVRNLGNLQRRLNLPAETTDTILAARSNYAVQSQQINANGDLSESDRKSQLQALAAKIKSELPTMLGPEGSQFFAQQAAWINMLQNGRAFSLDPADAPLDAPLSVGPRVWSLPPPKSGTQTK